MAHEAVAKVENVFINYIPTSSNVETVIRLVYKGMLDKQYHSKLKPYIYLKFTSIKDLDTKVGGLNLNALLKERKIFNNDYFSDKKKSHKFENELISRCSGKAFIIDMDFSNGINDFNSNNSLIAVINDNGKLDFNAASLVLNPNSVKDINDVNNLLSLLNARKPIKIDSYLKIDDQVNVDGLIWRDGNNYFSINGQFKINDNYELYDLDSNANYQATPISDGLFYSLNNSCDAFFVPSNSYQHQVAQKTIDQSAVVNNEYNQELLNTKGDAILAHFVDVLDHKYSFLFNEQDIANFHNSVKSFPLTILAGLSGSGKSKIATAYADAMGIKNDEQFNLVSVIPEWQSDSDLLGYVDVVKNIYRPSASGIADTLIAANRNPNKIYLIVLDEMNLSKVEHYFAQFLSAIEREHNERKIKLYNSNEQSMITNSDVYPHEVFISDNVRFIGTINIDESTFELSDKVLDRANLIKLSRVPFTELDNLPAKKAVRTEEISFDTYQKMIHNDQFTFEMNYLNFFDELYDAINKAMPTVGFSWRTINNIRVFMSNVNAYNNDNYGFDTRVAFDYQIAQRILPKIRGNRQMLAPLLDNNNLINLFNKYADISDFSVTKQQLTQKLREIKVIGFAN